MLLEIEDEGNMLRTEREIFQ